MVPIQNAGDLNASVILICRHASEGEHVVGFQTSLSKTPQFRVRALGAFEQEKRGTLYYVRAMQSPCATIIGEQIRCETDQQGQCLKAEICCGDQRTALQDDCLFPTAERAWSSPIFVDYVD